MRVYQCIINIKWEAILFLVLLLLLSDVYGQSFQVNLSSKHVDKINHAKSGAIKLKLYKKYYSKDSTKQMRKEKKEFKKDLNKLARFNKVQERKERHSGGNKLQPSFDTLSVLEQYASFLPNEELGNLKELESRFGVNSNEVKGYQKKIELKDSTLKKELRVKVLKKAREESIANLPPAQKQQLEELEKQYGSYSKEVHGYLGVLQDSVNLAQVLKEDAAKRAEATATQFAQQKVGGELKEFSEGNQKLQEIKNTPDQDRQKVDEYSDPDKLKSEAKQKAKEELVEKAVEHADKLQSVMNKMPKLKSKFSSLINSNDLSTGVKSRSLEGRPLRERWVIGGNYNIVSIKPFMFDLTPQFGYRIDKKFQIGLSGVYRAKFTSKQYSNSLSPQRMGYGAFSSYGLIMNFFAYGEFERSTIEITDSNAEQTSQWVNSLLLGAGKKFTIHPKVLGTVLFLWNPLHENGQSPYAEAFVIKAGFQVSELGMLKK